MKSPVLVLRSESTYWACIAVNDRGPSLRQALYDAAISGYSKFGLLIS